MYKTVKLSKKLTRAGNFLNGLVQFISHEADKAEDYKASIEAGGAVGTGNDNRIAEDVVVELVVAGQGDESAPAGSKREEDLDSSISPDLLTKDVICIFRD